MHPILSNRRNLMIYLTTWIPIVALLAYLLAWPGRITWLQSAVLMFFLCGVYAFVCLSAWYTCRISPIPKTDLSRVGLTHLVAGVFLALIWTGIGYGIAAGISRFTSLTKLRDGYSDQIEIVFGAGILLYLMSVAFHYVLLAQEDSRKAQARALETSILARDAELKALKAQINPHFLFNSLNSISALTSIDPKRAREMCLLLAEFLRMTLGMGEKALIPLSEELSLLERFLAIERVRFGSRLKTEEQIADDARPCLIPPLLLQPLVENAVTHGIANLPEGGCVRISASTANGKLGLRVENNFDPEAAPNRRNGMGIANVRKRLDARYGREASLQLEKQAHVFTVNISLPAERTEVTA